MKDNYSREVRQLQNSCNSQEVKIQTDGDNFDGVINYVSSRSSKSRLNLSTNSFKSKHRNSATLFKSQKRRGEGGESFLIVVPDVIIEICVSISTFDHSSTSYQRILLKSGDPDHLVPANGIIYPIVQKVPYRISKFPNSG
jgi:uncharacterized membrane protein